MSGSGQGRRGGSADLLVARLEAALPQTQCTRCGYPDCAGYARAIASEGAPINQCPPGGMEGVRRLAALTGQPAEPLNPVHGHEGPRTLAVIDEAWCIGCTLCIQACPTDAILGWAAWSPAQADAARLRYAQRQTRLARQAPPARPVVPDEAAAKQSVIAAALARARARRSYPENDL